MYILIGNNCQSQFCILTTIENNMTTIPKHNLHAAGDTTTEIS